MANYSVDLAINFTGETGYVICVPRKTTAPLTTVVCTIDGVPGQTRKVYPAPHTQVQMVIEELDPVIYFFKFYRSADGVALDEQINIIAIDAKTGASQTMTRYTYIVDRGNSSVVSGSAWADPVTGDTGIGDERLAGKTYYIEERGTGSLVEEEIVNRVAGGFDFAVSGKTFEGGGVYFAWVIAGVTASGVSTRVVTFDILPIAANITYDPSIHDGKVLKANFAGTVGTITMPLLSTVSDSTFKIDTHGGLQRNIILQLAIGNGVLFLGEALNKVVFGRGDTVTCKIQSNALYIYDYSGCARVRGERKFSDIILPNTWPLAGTGPHNFTDFPAVEQLINKLDPLSIVSSVTTWNNTISDNGVTKYINKGKWCVPTASPGTFYFPDTRFQFLRAIDFDYDGSTLTVEVDATRNSQGAGGFQKQILDTHFHPAGTETNPADAGVRRGSVRSVRAWSGGAGVAGANPASTDLNVGGQTGDTRPDNIGSIPLICI